MVSTLQTDSKKQAEVGQLASLKADHESKWHHCESGLSHNAHANARSGMGNKRANQNSLNPADDSVVEVIRETGSPSGRITAARERSCAWRNLLNVCSGRGFDSRRVHHFIPQNAEHMDPPTQASAPTENP